MSYKIVNLVASSSLGTTLDLYNLAAAIPDIEYEPEQFPGAIFKLKEPKVSLLLFKNGKIIISGAASENDIKAGIKKATKLISEIQKEVKVKNNFAYDIVNLVATSSLGKTVDLFQAAVTLDDIEYEPEQFPGAIIRLYSPKVTLLLFKNGKLICAGAKNENDIKKSILKVKKLLKDLKEV
ncbi:MAG: TATA-box-binding protein [archaeon]|jgi:transcription initiation factor TFIID TATA-box-binding protein|nr:TATA-box-binding protein [archaeon]MDD2477539.1 TATA-box-binding protein [Candidatus ainarchaeum sp.]MDD3084365.1 TATA-box-binding protein [Candidatus ainarchaeum sp.]MDD4221456.1 TATA-box-binding protein [Candidatus ainarchaeum sp.]MDD4662578.1 TATA-box-binding protein [Candidatus ainarchaeum sp.]